MSALSSSAHALIRAARAGLRPSITDRQRVSDALSTLLGCEPTGFDSTTHEPPEGVPGEDAALPPPDSDPEL